MSRVALLERAGPDSQREHSQRSPTSRDNTGSAPTMGRVPALRMAVQRLPAVSQPQDPLEIEAARAAQRVAAGGAAGPISTLHGGMQRVAVGEDEVQRVAVGEDEVQRVAVGEEHPGDELVQRLVQRLAQRPPAMTPNVASTLHSNSGGTPVPPSVRSAIEPGLGVGLGGVQVHDGPQAQDVAARLQARALTYGNHIFLGRDESPYDVPLMAHEATHVVQQGGIGAAQGGGATGEQVQRLPSQITEGLASYARHIPGYTLFTVVVGSNPLTGEAVERNAVNVVGGIIGLVPFGTAIFDRLVELGVIDEAFEFIDRHLATFDLSVGRIERMIAEAWDQMDFLRLDPFEYNLGILVDKFSRLLNDVRVFAASILSGVLDLIKDAVIDVAEPFLAENKAWALIKKVLRYDPLRNVPVDASTVEILEDFLRLIGRETELEQMRVRGTLQETADWIDTQLAVFQSLVTELGALFAAAWDAIRPENLPDLMTNLRALAARALALLQRAWDFAGTVAAKVLELVKKSLLGWLSEFAHELPGFHLVTVILGRNPFTGDEVPRTATNIIRGFITLLPNGNATYDQLAESGVIEQAAANIEGAMAELGISWAMVTGLFRGIWNALSIDDLVDPIGVFQRIRDQFGEPIARLFAFVRVVLREIFQLVLALMNFPTDVLGRIITNAMQAFEDIKRDPVAFLLNMLSAVKQGFSRFFAGIFDHLLAGLTAWLFRGLQAAGIQPPTELTLRSGLDLLMQVLGITVDRLWQKLAERIGQERVDKIRAAIDRLTGIWTFVRDVQEGGVSAIWQYVQGQLSNLWEMIVGKARDWIMEKIVARVTAKLLSMLDPTGVMAVINSFIAFFNAVQSAVEYIREILDIVDRFVGTIASVARGDIEPGAAMMEQGLIAAVPVAIGFLANQVGLGNIGDKITEIVGGLRALVDQALDWLLDQAERVLQSLLSALGFGTTPPAAAPAPSHLVDQLPPGLPPKEVKRRVLDGVTSRLAQGGITDISSVHGFLQTVLTANRERGLTGLRLQVVDPVSMAVEVTAYASPPEVRRLAWAEIFPPSAINTDTELAGFRARLAKASQASYAALAVDGVRVGDLSQSGGGVHAEEGLVRSSTWDHALVASRQGVLANGRSTLTLMINRSPCISCTQWLITAVRGAKERLGTNIFPHVVFRLAATGTYRRQARIPADDMTYLRVGSQQMAERLGRPFDQVFTEQQDIWREDLRSFSTEWTGSDEEFSGLKSLAESGWQIWGLDAGGALTPRRMEMGEVAARLAKKFGWGS
ncbi:MAG: DUF4157 domain-containing protein [Hyphomicrobiales bacterium]|nr:MAG: DUF4157 domain-containing protein [Hyphomicrobiales bacterium]